MNTKHTPRAIRRLAAALALLLAGLLLLSACGRGRVRPPACGERRINLSLAMYERAKEKLSLHFQQRVDTALTDAFHASQDSVLLARATRNCFDFNELTRRQAIDLIKSNLLFQKLVTSNMRDQDPGVVVDLYGNRYREMFRNDIQ